MISYLRTALVGMAAFASVPACAGDNGFYVALDAGQAKLSEVCDAAALRSQGIVGTFTSCPNKLASYRASVGYQLDETVAVEGGYTRDDPFSGKIAGTLGGVPYTANGSDRLTELQLALIADLPPVNDITLFVKGGVVRWNLSSGGTRTIGGVSRAIDTSDHGYAGLLGLGVKYAITRQVNVRVQYETHRAGSIYSSGVGTVDMTTLGLTYQF